jgi:hypothetical protein
VVEIDLTRFRRRARIGSKGDIKIAGDGVLDHHAEIVAGPDESEWLLPIGSDIWLERRGLRDLVTRPRRLFDHDVIVIHAWRLQYHNLQARRDRASGRTTSWMR